MTRVTEGDQVDGIDTVLDVVDESDGQDVGIECRHFLLKSNIYKGYPGHGSFV